MSKRKFFRAMLCVAFASLPLLANAQGLAIVNETIANPDNEPALVHPVPHPRQLKWMQTEFYGFFHYGMNTYTDQEWGYGNEPESQFAPTAAPNPEQWLTACQAAGMRGGIAVVKHHDGFCLWPTETTTHSIKNAGNDYGRNTNIPRDFAAAAQKLGMKYGFYVSPWDRNSAYYGTQKYVTDVFLRQCSELAQYGSDQFEMWFDGANGGDGYYGGKNTKISVDRATYYDVPNLRDTVHAVCPECVLWGVGGEARWIGNEDGYAGVTNWLTDNRVDGKDQPNAESGSEDGWFWLPGESDAKGTDKGWFYHPGERALTSEQLYKIYMETVGRNATLILNMPPARDGKLPSYDVTALEGLGTLLKNRLGDDIDMARTARIEVSDTRSAGANRSYGITNAIDGNTDTYWAANDGTTTATITLSWDQAKSLHYVMLQEHVGLGQRIQDFKIETSADGNSWTEKARTLTTTVGYKRIIPLNGSTSSYGSATSAKYVRITITKAKACPTLERIGIF